MMKKLVVLLGMVVLAGGSAVAQPKLVVDGGSSFALDTLMAGVVAEHKVVVRNTGSEPLEIEKVEAACGCTGTMVSTQTIPPGGAGDLLVTFNSKNFSGSVHKSVTIYSNDPDKGSERVDFTAYVVQEVQVSESRFVFKDAVVGERSTVEVTLTNNSKQTLELKGYETSLEGLTLQYPPTVNPGQSVELVAEFVPNEAKRALSSNLKLTTSSESKPEVLFYVFGSVKEWKFE